MTMAKNLELNHLSFQSCKIKDRFQISLPIPDEERKINLNFIYTLLCGALKNFMTALNARGAKG